MRSRTKAGLLSLAAFVISMGALAALYQSQRPAPDLNAAINRNDTEAIGYALAHGASPNEPDPAGFYPLTIAVSFGNEEAVKLLIDAGAKLGQIDERGMDALLQAIMGKKPAITQLLIDRGAPIVNPRRASNLLYIAAVLDTELVKILLRAGADPNPKLRDGESPLQNAIAADSPETIRLLLAAGATPVEKDRSEKTSLARVHDPQSPGTRLPRRAEFRRPFAPGFPPGMRVALAGHRGPLALGRPLGPNFPMRYFPLNPPARRVG